MITIISLLILTISFLTLIHFINKVYEYSWNQEEHKINIFMIVLSSMSIIFAIFLNLIIKGP